jgi:hypothetical protein
MGGRDLPRNHHSNGVKTVPSAQGVRLIEYQPGLLTRSFNGGSNSRYDRDTVYHLKSPLRQDTITDRASATMSDPARLISNREINSAMAPISQMSSTVSSPRCSPTRAETFRMARRAPST